MTMKRILSYVAVAAASVAVTTWMWCFGPLSGLLTGGGKLEELSWVIQDYFIGEVDVTQMEDAAAYAMVDALGDRWSYYIPASEWASFENQMENAYVGVGITITERDDGYADILEVIAGAPAEKAGVKPGDILTAVDGADAARLGITEAGNRVSGAEGTQVVLTVRRGEQTLDIPVERAFFQVPVATSAMLEGSIGYIAIENFDERCAQETLEAIEALLEQDAKALVFDVRNNPGGYQTELVKVLDYLLPEGELFRSEYYDGSEDVDYSDENFLDIPMAVLVNSESYSAAEFFAAALGEYEAAIIVGEPTTGKGYFQTAIQLADGSAVGLSIGKYYTPKGVSLADTGIRPDVEVYVDDDTFLEIYYGQVPLQDDPQVQAAIQALGD